MSVRRFQCAGGWRTMFSQPCSLSLGHRVVAEGIFACNMCALQDFQRLSEFSRSFLVVLAFRHICRQRDSESQSVLPITYLGVANQPIPVHPKRVRHSQPRQPLSNSGIKVWLVQRLKQASRRVPPPFRPKIGGPG